MQIYSINLFASTYSGDAIQQQDGKRFGVSTTRASDAGFGERFALIVSINNREKTIQSFCPSVHLSHRHTNSELPSRYVTSHPGQLSLAIPSWIGVVSSNGYDKTASSTLIFMYGLLTHMQFIKSLAVRLSRPSGRSG